MQGCKYIIFWHPNLTFTQGKWFEILEFWNNRIKWYKMAEKANSKAAHADLSASISKCAFVFSHYQTCLAHLKLTYLKISESNGRFWFIFWPEYHLTHWRWPWCLVSVIPRFSVSPSEGVLAGGSSQLTLSRCLCWQSFDWFVNSDTIWTSSSLTGIVRLSSLCITHFVIDPKPSRNEMAAWSEFENWKIRPWKLAHWRVLVLDNAKGQSSFVNCGGCLKVVQVCRSTKHILISSCHDWFTQLNWIEYLFSRAPAW